MNWKKVTGIAQEPQDVAMVHSFNVVAIVVVILCLFVCLYSRILVCILERGYSFTGLIVILLYHLLLVSGAVDFGFHQVLETGSPFSIYVLVLRPLSWNLFQ